MDGILNILKPPGVTSFNVVSKVRRLVQIKKVGHTGTLDPDAVGVLPLCLGRGTRMVEFLMDDHKFYRGEITLGTVTDTQDAQGRVLASQPIPDLTKEELSHVLGQFVGKIQQIPPMVSAVKHQGKRLYELARQGIEVEREPRTIEIFSCRLLKFESPRLWIDVECSKGTYIRTLAHDLGQALGCGAHLSYLIRTGTGQFSLDNSVTLNEVGEAAQKDCLRDILLPLDWGIQSFPKVMVTEQGFKKAINGAKLTGEDLGEGSDKLVLDSLIRVYGPDGFISVCRVVDPILRLLHPVKVFA